VIDDLRLALNRTAQIVGRVQPGQYGRPTPCPDFDVRALMNHLVAGNLLFADVASGRGLNLALFDEDQLGDDPGAAFRRAAEIALAAWQRPGALDEQLAFGNLPGHVVIKLHLTEELTHGWDLARATGQDATFDDRLAEIALETVRGMPHEMVRQPAAFGPEVPVASTAPAHERLIAFLGRDPATAFD
jgi:uncharacterized protein (TIGR03086 family)